MAIRERKLDEAPNGPTGGGPTEPEPSTKSNVISGFRRALEDYKDAVNQAWRQEDASFRLNQVLQTETIVASKAATDYASFLEQQASIARKLQDAWIPPEFHDVVNRGLTDYVTAVKTAWADVDPATVTPAELGHIAQLIEQAASLIAVPVNRNRR